MPSSSSNKKLHCFDLPDDLKWSNQEKNQRLTRRAPVRSPGSNQPQPMNQNGSKSTEDNEKQNSTTKGDKKPKPAKVDSKASTSKVSTKDKKPGSKNKIWEALENIEDKYCKPPTFSITLTREEIEQDFLAMTGRKLPRNTLKRDKNVQRDLDVLFPGLSLEGRNAENLPKKY